jgi:hypothetical protein
MKRRRWIALLGVLLLACGILAWHELRSVERSRGVERILVKQLSEKMGGTFEVERVRLGFFSAYLSNVSFSMPMRTFRLDVHDIKVGISLAKLIRNRGDIGASISKIILVSPVIELAYSDSSFSDSASNQLFSGDFPVEKLLVQKGAVNLLDHGRDTVLSASDLDGELKIDRLGMHYELKGRMGAAHKNLTLSGSLPAGRGRHRVSFRLRRANIRHGVRWRNAVISSGILDGAGEFALPDTLSLSKMESDGWIKLENAEAMILDGRDTVSGIHMHVRFSGSRFILDSAQCSLRAAVCFAEGSWDFAVPSASGFRARCSNVQLEKFSDSLPAGIGNVQGGAWVEASCAADGPDVIAVKAQAGGVTFRDVQHGIITMDGRIDYPAIFVDSLILSSGEFRAGINGLVNIEKKPYVYDLGVWMRAQAGSAGGFLVAGTTFDGTVRGLGADARVDGLLTVDSARAFGLNLGNPRIRVAGTGRQLAFECLDGAYFRLEGTADSVFGVNPFLSAQLTLEKQALSGSLDSAPEWIEDAIDSMRIFTSWSGPLSRIDMTGKIEMQGPGMAGALDISGTKTDSSMSYRVRDSKLFVTGKAFRFSADGTMRADTLHIDSIRALNGAVASGTIVTSAPAKLSINVTCANVPLKNLDEWFLGGRELVQGGFMSAAAKITGTVDNPDLRARINVKNAELPGISRLGTEVAVIATGSTFRMLPFRITMAGRPFVWCDTLYAGKKFKLSGRFEDIDLGRLFDTIVPPEYRLSGHIFGKFASGDSGLPVAISAFCLRVSSGSFHADSVSMRANAGKSGIIIESVQARDSNLCRISGNGFVPWSFFADEQPESDTLKGSLLIEGDILATIARQVDSPVGGTGKGVIRVSFSAAGEEWNFSEARATIPSGVLTLVPFVLDDITPFSANLSLDSAGRLHTSITAKIRRQPVNITSTHVVPAGYEPLKIGSINAGILQARTGKQGIPIHLPGFQQIGDRVDIVFQGKKPFEAFAISGPVDRPRITGVWICSQTEFTYPFLETDEIPWEFDPSPFITWELDVRPGNRMVYFYDAGTRHRKFIRFCELTLDQGGEVRMRGRMVDNTFKLHGNARSYRGAVYFGKVFDRNIDAGVEFTPEPMINGGFDNMPIIWGSAEAYSDTNRMDRIRLNLLIKDAQTGAMAEKGRFNEISFRVSSDFDELPGESEREFFREAGLNFVSIKGAGGMVSDFGKQYLRRYFVQRLEKQVARRLGLDVVTFESSIAANYFNYLYNNQFHGLESQWDYLALANVGVTLGRYFMQDKLLLKWRSELIPVESFLQPEHSIGFEYQPMRYLLLDVSYGFHYHEKTFEYNPKMYLQLRLPINNLRNIMNF